MTNSSNRDIGKIRYTQNELTLLLLLIPFFRPDCIPAMFGDSALNTIFTLWRVAAFAYIVCCFLKQRTVVKNKELFLIVLFSLVLCASAMINKIGLSGSVINMMNFVGIFLIYLYHAKKNPRSFIRVNFFLMAALTITNALLLLVFPMGLNHASHDAARINFLGKDNTLYLYGLLTVAFCTLYANIEPRSRMPIVVFWIVVGTQLYLFSATGVAVFAILLVYLFLNPDRAKPSVITKPVTLIVIFAVLEILIVFLRQFSFMERIISLLNKDMTFSDRIYYWSAATRQFLASPLLGQGSGIVNLWNAGYYSHNAILDVLLKGGIVGLCAWIPVICIPAFSLRNTKNHRVARSLSVILFCFLVSGLMEGLEDRIAFNAFISLLTVYPILENQPMVNRALLDRRVPERKIHDSQHYRSRL